MKIEFCPEDNCQGPDCPRHKAQRQRPIDENWGRTLGLTESIEQGAPIDREFLVRILTQEIMISQASDKDGVLHMTPMAAQYEIHTSAARDPNRICFTAVYCGPQRVDELLAAEPEWTEELMRERMRLSWESAAV